MGFRGISGGQFTAGTAESRQVMTMRALAFVIVAVTLGGCMQGTIEPATQAGWKPRDKELMSNLPYNQNSPPDCR